MSNHKSTVEFADIWREVKLTAKDRIADAYGNYIDVGGYLGNTLLSVLHVSKNMGLLFV